MADLSQIIAEIPVIGTGHSQRLPIFLGIHGHQEIDIVRSRLIALSEHGSDDRLEGLEQVGLAGRVLAHIELPGNLTHGITVIDSLGVDTEVCTLLGSQQEIHLLRDMEPILIGADTAAILVELEQVNLPLFVHDTPNRNLVVALLLVLDPDSHKGQGRDGGEHRILRVLALLKAHIPDGRGVLIDFLGHGVVRLGRVLILAILDCIVVILDKGFRIRAELCQFGGAFFSGHVEIPFQKFK